MSVLLEGGHATTAPTLNQIAPLLGPFAVATGEVGIVDASWPVFHAKRYGAVGDGVHDDTAAIQAALDSAIAAGGGVAVLPIGHFKTSANLVINVAGASVSSVGLEGAPHGGSTLVPTAAVTRAIDASVISGDPASSVSGQVHIKNLQIDGAATAGATGILLGGNALITGYSVLEDILIYRFNGAGARALDVRNVVGLHAIRVDATRCTVGVHIESANVSLPTFMAFDHCRYWLGTRGVNVVRGYRITFSDCVVESNTGEGVYVVPVAGQNVLDLSFDRCWFEGNCSSTGTYQIQIDGSAAGTISPKFRSCTFNSNPGLHVKGVGNLVIDDPSIPNVADFIFVDTGCSGHVTSWPENNAVIRTTLKNLSPVRVSILEAAAIDRLAWDLATAARPNLYPLIGNGLDLGKPTLPFGQVFASAFHQYIEAPAWGASVTPTGLMGTSRIIASSNIGWGLQVPAAGGWGSRVTIVVRNSSGGAMGATTFSGAYSQVGYVNPPDGSETSAEFEYDLVKWRQRTPWVTVVL